MKPREIKAFQDIVYAHYKKNKRDFPWRRTKDPYHILVSEIMLQQTQTDRVVPKFNDFLAKFPTVETLAKAPLKAVLSAWQGLGYNRRGLMLHNAAKEICATYGGIVPKTEKELISLTGIGPYTAAAIMAFAFNTPTVVIETNIRAVFIHHFFKNKEKIGDKAILPLIQETLDVKNPRRWYSALMDYGTALKKEHKNPSKKSAHYSKQSKFKGSDREIRGAIVRELTRKNSSKQTLFKKLAPYEISSERFETILEKLERERLITNRKNIFTLA
jgi:A/G-specific adenine glycosylase